MRPLAFTDGGIETSMIFKEGFDLPCFAAFPLVLTEPGRAALRRYFGSFLALADRTGQPFVLDTATWRASPEWGAQLSYSPEQLASVNREAVSFAVELAAGRPNVTISGLVGPRGDGYLVGKRMTETEGEAYHAPQVEVLAAAGADRITALTLTYPDEAVGIVRAAQVAGLPVVVGFTVETDGRLPCGDGLRDGIAYVDRQTGSYASFFIVNCAHPLHFAHVFEDGGAWLERIGGVRANASARSHAELDEAEELDEGDLDALADHHRRLSSVLPAVELLGGCCGTDHRHVEAIVAAWVGGVTPRK